MKKFTIKDMTVTAIMASVLCVMSPFTIPTGIIPISLGSFAIYLSGAILGAKKGSIAVLLYILLGAAGLPVFSNFSGGFGKIAGPTGGYIIGYLFCVLIVGLAADFCGNKIWVFPLSMFVGTLVLYTFGTAWFMIQSGNGLLTSLGYCVFPFLIGDAIKITVASGVTPSIRKILTKRFLLN